ncbi:hypothetical protein ACQ4M3_00995 [Leptolyngbya sp. AN03gr2]|uniref:hypothetical protein n=1 Tax=unclassified Leptolyngbya TaxID=2650499 RepID=UPI003D317E55
MPDSSSDAPLNVTPVLYPVTRIDQAFFSTILSDREFREAAAELIRYDQYVAFERLERDRELIQRLTGIELPEVLAEYRYISGRATNDPSVVANYNAYITAASMLVKMIAWDAIYVLLRIDTVPATLPNSNLQKDYYDHYWTSVRGCVEVSIKNALSYLVEIHPEFKDENGLNTRSEVIEFIRLLLKLTIHEMLRSLCWNNWSYFDRTPRQYQQSIVGIVDLEFGLIQRNPESLSDAKDAEAVISARVERLFTLLGVAQIRNIEAFTQRLIKLSIGAKVATFGVHKNTIKGVGAAKPGVVVYGSSLAKMTRREQMHGGSPVGEQIIKQKMQNRSLRQKYRESESIATGGDVIVLCDATGSTLPDGCYGLCNLLEAINIALIDAAIKSDRKITIYWYNEGTTKVETFTPSESQASIQAKKIAVYQRSQARQNDEVTTFTEVFHEVSRQAGKKVSIIFMSDGGMLTMGRETETEAAKLKALMALHTNIEVLPVLIAPSMDRAFRTVFENHPVLHIQDANGFGADDLKKMIDFVKASEDPT